VLPDSAIERLDDLNIGTTPLKEGVPHEKPHKPLLLLAIFDHHDPIGSPPLGQFPHLPSEGLTFKPRAHK
jgi:hypothetical protein